VGVGVPKRFIEIIRIARSQTSSRRCRGEGGDGDGLTSRWRNGAHHFDAGELVEAMKNACIAKLIATDPGLLTDDEQDLRRFGAVGRAKAKGFKAVVVVV
jgi:hypothetical protein